MADEPRRSTISIWRLAAEARDRREGTIAVTIDQGIEEAGIDGQPNARSALLTGHAVHPLVHDLHQGAGVALGEDVGANVADNHFLEASGVDPGRIARIVR